MHEYGSVCRALHFMMVYDQLNLPALASDFLLYYDAWLKKSGVRISDRSMHEYGSVCRALHFMMVYDQLNLSALASVEALNRRRALVEHAHQGRLDVFSYEAAEEIMGIKDLTDGSLVDPSLLQYAARRQAAKVEVLKQIRLIAEERRYIREDKPTRKGDGKGTKEKPQKQP